MELKIHYQKFGHEEDPQFRIVKAVLEWTSDNNRWEFKRPSTESKQRFYAQLGIQFYPVESQLQLVTPVTPKIGKPLSKYTLYPFTEK